jgi:hypothetical protein
MRTREELLELLRSIVENEGQYAADKVLDISQLLEEERNG